jgi:hypothetical protein
MYSCRILKFCCRELETLKLVCNNFYQFGNYATFGNSCNIYACDVKYDGIVSLDSPSCEVPCLILLSVVCRDVTR